MTKYISLFCLAVFGLIACSDPTPEEQLQKELWDEVMVIHDDVMPKISDINKSVKAFKNIRENNEEAFTKYREQILIHLQNLESAEEGMFSWMNNLKQLSDLRKNLDHEGIMAHLNKEKEAVTKVKDDMLSSLADSQTLIEKIKADTQQ